MPFETPFLTANINGESQSLSIYDYEWIRKRTIRIYENITSETAKRVTAQIEYLSEQSEEPIILLLHSNGGEVHAGRDIYDAIKACPCEIKTVCRGVCASMAAFLLAAGKTRFATAESEIMIHQPSAGVSGMISHMEADIEHFRTVKKRLNKILAENTGKTEEEIENATEKDNWLSPKEALAFGIIDSII